MANNNDCMNVLLPNPWSTAYGKLNANFLRQGAQNSNWMKTLYPYYTTPQISQWRKSDHPESGHPWILDLSDTTFIVLIETG